MHFEVHRGTQFGSLLVGKLKLIASGCSATKQIANKESDNGISMAAILCRSDAPSEPASEPETEWVNRASEWLSDWVSDWAIDWASDFVSD